MTTLGLSKKKAMIFDNFAIFFMDFIKKLNSFQNCTLRTEDVGNKISASRHVQDAMLTGS